MSLNNEELVQRFLEAHQRWCEILTEAEQQAIHDSTSFLKVCKRDLRATRILDEAEPWLADLIKTSHERAKRAKSVSGTTEAAHGWFVLCAMP